MTLFETITELHAGAASLSYPKDIEKVPSPLAGTAFFPGGNGLYLCNKNADHSIKYMIVGQDYDNEDNYQKIKDTENQCEVAGNNVTWRNLLKIIDEAGIARQECFFTNALMGLRSGSTKNTGPSILFKSENKTDLNQHVAFFRKQIELIKPKAIIAMGGQLPRFIGNCYPEDPQLNKLSGIRSFKMLDNLLGKQSFQLPTVNGFIPIVFITHTSLYFANVGNRMKYESNGSSNGINYEREKLKQLSDSMMS